MSGRGKLTEADVKASLREVRRALLEADVHFRVARDFVSRVEDSAVGERVTKSFTPGEEVLKIVYTELVELLGKERVQIYFASSPPTTIMLVGLQGCGKTTTCVKLASTLKRQGHNPLVVACDVKRPAAQDQLHLLADQAHIAFYGSESANVAQICQTAVAYARQQDHTVVLLDTAGRLHIDGELMAELLQIKSSIHPHQTILVADGMAGQDAVVAAVDFNQAISIDGVILTKLDSDARGGAALSIRAVTGRPIIYIGVGEGLDDLDEYHPDRMASRILGMGDLASLVEKAEDIVQEEEARLIERKILKEQFDLEDFRTQIRQLKKMGGLGRLVGMIPGMGGQKLKGIDLDERALVRVEAIINSMTPEERSNPQILNGRRRKRIAKGSGTSVEDVNRLLKQFSTTRKLMKSLASGKAPRGSPLQGFGF
jgi:signal recognition particle subunit SRP54